ncbi:DUF222 domain-containing protein [Kibdelosporangium lantanae]|uniref:DUF222 domain-containing protein n=1 Tax=Kibdelosporangium lantanae TaxID=1497396 RepID=A0ABW3M5L4_9PSEU
MIQEEFLLQFREVKPPADIPIDTMTEAQCLDVIAEADRMIAHCGARTTQAMARFAELRPPMRPGIDLADGAREELSMELGISPRAAAIKINQARELATRLPETLAALDQGNIDMARAHAMAELTRVLSDEDAKEVERRVLSRGRRTSLARFKAAIRLHVSKVDKDAMERQRQEAQQTRDVTYQPCYEDMGLLSATFTEAEATVARRRLDRLTEYAHAPKTTRTADQVKADVLLELILGKADYDVALNATVSVDALKALQDNEQAKKLIAEHPTWRHMITDPAGHTLQDNNSAPSRTLTRYLHARDRTCRVPGCTAIAETSEVDHTVRRADSGPTNPGNTGAYCKYHNLWKERSSWQVSQPSPGTFTFVSPEGRVYTSPPEPYEEPSQTSLFEPIGS